MWYLKKNRIGHVFSIHQIIRESGRVIDSSAWKVVDGCLTQGAKEPAGGSWKKSVTALMPRSPSSVGHSALATKSRRQGTQAEQLRLRKVMSREALGHV